MLRISMTMLSLLILLTGCQAQADAEESEQKQLEQTAPEESPHAQFITSAEKGDTRAVRSLLQQGVDIDAQDERGRTAIMAATHGNHPETVKTLIDAGADINRQDDIQDNPFLYAGATGKLDILRLLIDAGADTKLLNRYGGTALIPASEHAFVDVVKELLTRSTVDVNHVNNLGWTALLEAIILGDGGPAHQKVVQLLVDHGADVNLPDKAGVTPLQHAKKRGYTSIQHILVEAGAK